MTSRFGFVDLLTSALCLDTANNESLNALVPSAHKLQSKLFVLASSLLGMTIQQRDAHNPDEDALASLRLFLQQWKPLGDTESRATLSDGRTINFFLCNFCSFIFPFCILCYCVCNVRFSLCVV